MNSNPTIFNKPSNHSKGARSKCQYSGHLLCKSKQAKVERAIAKPVKSLRTVIEEETEKEAAILRAKRLIDRTDYLHLIPVGKRSKYMPEHEEMRYQFLLHYEKATPEQRLIMSQPTAHDIDLMAFLGTLMTRRAEKPYQCPVKQPTKI
jgi:hypothetical protein